MKGTEENTERKTVNHKQIREQQRAVMLRLEKIPAFPAM